MCVCGKLRPSWTQKKAKQKHILVFVLTFLIVISTSIDRLFFDCYWPWYCSFQYFLLKFFKQILIDRYKLFQFVAITNCKILKNFIRKTERFGPLRRAVWSKSLFCFDICCKVIGTAVFKVFLFGYYSFVSLLFILKLRSCREFWGEK